MISPPQVIADDRVFHRSRPYASIVPDVSPASEASRSKGSGAAEPQFRGTIIVGKDLMEL